MIYTYLLKLQLMQNFKINFENKFIKRQSEDGFDYMKPYTIFKTSAKICCTWCTFFNLHQVPYLQ